MERKRRPANRQLIRSWEADVGIPLRLIADSEGKPVSIPE